MGRNDETVATDAVRAIGPVSHHETIAAAGVVRLADRRSPSSFDATLGAPSMAPTSAPLDDLRYLALKELGRGGMGRVDLVFDASLGRTVARKKVLDHRHASLLENEARICAQLEHPAIVPLYDLAIDASGDVSYTMRVITGRTLRDVLVARDTDPDLSLAKLLSIFRQICLAVAYAHTRGVVHRDLKPENVLIGAFGEVYVLDWGVAYVMPDADLVRVGETQVAIAGSPGYMAPEQILDGEIGPRTDVFALGVMLFEIVAGRPPFEETDLGSMVSRATDARSIPPPSAVARINAPSALDDLVRSCLRRKPSERTESARTIAQAIDGFLDAERALRERARDADEAVATARAAEQRLSELDARAAELRAAAARALAELRPWDPVERKQPAWSLSQEADLLSADAARALAEAETAYSAALGKVPDHTLARRGLSKLHHRQFLAAEARADRSAMAHYLALARAYDDGALTIELADEGELRVETIPPGATVSLERYEPRGLLLVRGARQELGAAPTAARWLASGSYLVTATEGATRAQQPVVIERGHRHTLTIDLGAAGRVPSDLAFVGAGPFLSIGPRGARTVERLGGFAIARFPVTLSDFARYLDDTGAPTPEDDGEPILLKRGGRWCVTEACIAGEGRRRVAEEDLLALPVFQVSWYEAARYARWLAKARGLPLRLPTALEWEKAKAGADARAFPMGPHLDPAFAKLRQSRPEATQPEPVGAFALDESPYGVRDLAGGVGDWTCTAIDGAELDPEDDALDGEREVYWRGGHWGLVGAVHNMYYPMKISHHTSGIGFRVAMTVPDDASSLVVDRLA